MARNVVDLRTTLTRIGFVANDDRTEYTYGTRNGAIILAITTNGPETRILVKAKHDTKGYLMSKGFKHGPTTWGTFVAAFEEASNMLAA